MKTARVLAQRGGFAPDADLSTVRDDEDLREALDLDSMDFMNFVIGLADVPLKRLRHGCSALAR